MFDLKKALIRNVIMIPNRNNYKYQQKSFFKRDILILCFKFFIFYFDIKSNIDSEIIQYIKQIYALYIYFLMQDKC